MPINYNNLQSLGGGFKSANTEIPMAGQLESPYLRYTQTAIVAIDGLVEGDLVTIMNSDSTNEAGTSGLDKFNPNSLTVTAKATSVTDLSGVLLRSPNQIGELNNIPVPAVGSYSYVATLGSGLETYLECDDTVSEINVGTDLTYDFAEEKFTTTSSDDTATISVKAVSGVVNGTKKVLTDGIASYEDCLVIKVKF